MIVDNDVESIDNDTRENKNKIVFLILLGKIATLCTWRDHWKNGYNDKRRFECVSVNQFSSLTGKRNTGLRKWSLILAFLHAESIFRFLNQKKEKISKYWYNGVGKFLLLIFLVASCNSMHWTIENFWIQPPRLYLLSRPPTQQLSSKKKNIR